jgi:four helix bundle protein
MEAGSLVNCGRGKKEEGSGLGTRGGGMMPNGCRRGRTLAASYNENAMTTSASTVHSYRDLRAWQAAYALALRCYAASTALPRAERFGLVSQMRRAAASVPANIAEGNGRMSRGEYVRFLRIAHGSLRELETHVMLARDLEYLAGPAADALLCDSARVGRLLGALIRSLAGGWRG